MSNTDESFKTSAAIFKKYQTVIHNEPDEECGEDEFVDNLVDTPLKVNYFVLFEFCFISIHCEIISCSSNLLLDGNFTF